MQVQTVTGELLGESIMAVGLGSGVSSNSDGIDGEQLAQGVTMTQLQRADGVDLYTTFYATTALSVLLDRNVLDLTRPK